MTKDERIAKTKEWLSQKVEGVVEPCETCRWYHVDPGHCKQYSTANLYRLCLRIKMTNARLKAEEPV